MSGHDGQVPATDQSPTRERPNLRDPARDLSNRNPSERSLAFVQKREQSQWRPADGCSGFPKKSPLVPDS